MLMFNIFLVTLALKTVSLLSLGANRHCNSGWDRNRLDYNMEKCVCVSTVPGGRGRQRPLMASRIRNMKWNTDHSAGLPCCVLENTHTHAEKFGWECYATGEHTWREVIYNLHMWTHTQWGVWGSGSTHAWRWTHTFCQRFILNITLVGDKTFKETNWGEKATHKHKARGLSLYFSQAVSSMCLMSSS